MENSIDYQKVEVLDENVTRLLRKLEGVKPFEVLKSEIEGQFVSIIQVFYNSRSCGILIVRGEVDYNSKLHLIICHAIAEDFLVQTFSDILGHSIFYFAKSKGFDFIRQHADKKGLCRLLEKYYGQPTEYIYQKDLNLWAAETQNQNKSVNSQQQTTINE